MSIQFNELQSLLIEIESENNDNDIPSIQTIQEKIEKLQIKSNGVMQDFADCCFEQQDQISTQQNQISTLTQQIEQYHSDQPEDGAVLCESIKYSLQETTNDYHEMMNDEFIHLGQLANIYEQISLFMLDAAQKTAFIPSPVNEETQVDAQSGNHSEIHRRSSIPKASLHEIKQVLQEKGQDTENKMINLVQKICDEMEGKHGKQIDNLHKTNDDYLNKMKALIVELNMHKYSSHHITSPKAKVTNNYKKFALILVSSWIILGGIFAKYHFYVIEQLKTQYAQPGQKPISMSISMVIPIIVGMLITMGLTRSVTSISKILWNVCKLIWNGIKWIFEMILPKSIYVMVFEFGEKKKWKRRGSSGRLASYEQDFVTLKKVKVRGK